MKLDARVCTIQDRGVLDQFVPTPHERIVEYDPPLVKYSIRAEVEALMQEVEKASPTGGKKRKWVAVPTAPPEENTENAAAERGNGPEEKGGVENMEVDGTREVGVSESVSGEGSTEDPGNRGENESAKSGEGRMLYWKKREEGGKSTTLLQKLGSILYVLDELGQWFAYKVCAKPFWTTVAVSVVSDCLEGVGKDSRMEKF